VGNLEQGGSEKTVGRVVVVVVVSRANHGKDLEAFDKNYRAI